MTYNNLPVYIEDSNNVLGENGFVMADSVSVSHDTSLSPNKNKNTYRQNNPLATKINVSAFFHEGPSGYSGYNFLDDVITSTGSSSLTIKVGDNTFLDCYIDQYSIEVSPFQPVVLKADFSSYNPATGTQISGDYSPNDPEMDSDGIVYGHTCELSGTLGPVTYTKIDYIKRYDRTPVYTLGSINPTRQLIDNVEVEMRVDSTGLSSLISFGGEEIIEDFGVILKNASGYQIPATPEIIMGSGAIISAHNYSSQGGGSLSTTTTIKEIIL